MRRVQALCEAEKITGYPTIRVYRDGSDDILVRGGYHGHEMYRGDRTYEALKAFVDGLVTPAAAAPTRDNGMVRPQRIEEPCMHQRCPRSAPMLQVWREHNGNACRRCMRQMRGPRSLTMQAKALHSRRACTYALSDPVDHLHTAQ